MGASQPSRSHDIEDRRPSTEPTPDLSSFSSGYDDGTDFPFGYLAPKNSAPSEDSNSSIWPEAPQARSLIPDGDYNGEILKYEIHNNYRFPGKRSLLLQIRVSPPEGEPVVLARFLNYYSKPTPGTDYYKEWVKVHGKRPSRLDRLWPSEFVGKMVRVRVRKVVKDQDGDDQGDLQYSVVGKILGLL